MIILSLGRCIISIDGISICMLIIIYVISVISKGYILNKIIYSIIYISCNLTFIISDIIYFIILYEWILIRISILIISTGSLLRKEGLLKLVYYTLIGSIFLLVLIGVILSNSVSSNYYYSLYLSVLNYVLLSVRLVMKYRIYRFLTWLLSALTESNIIGSIILSGIILKISIYGWYRYNMSILVMYYSKGLIVLGIISILISSLYSIISIDIKKIIAYCSVILMSIIFVGILNNSILGSWLISITLSIISSSLFYIVSLIYILYLSRNVLYIRLLYCNYVFYIFFFLYILSNISFRMTCSFIREFIIFLLLYNSLGSLSILILITVLLGSILSMYLSTRVLFNIKSLFLIKYIDINRYLSYNLSSLSIINIMSFINVNIFSSYIG